LILANNRTSYKLPNTFDVSIIIPAYNNSQTIGSVLASLGNQRYQKGQVEVIIVDDASTDSTVQICEKMGFIIMKNDQNSGLGFSLNKGILSSKNQIIVTLHGDTIPLTDSWLSELVEPLDNPRVAATCSLQQTPLFAKSSNELSLFEKLLWGKLDEHNALNDKADAYKKAVLSEIGLFDCKTFRTAGEDEDIALRLRSAGYSIVGTNARVIHYHFQPCKSSAECLKKILKKEFTFGRAGGALRRKIPLYKPGTYLHPTQRSFVSDGLLRTSICLACLVPYVQLAFIIPLMILCSVGSLKTYKKIRSRRGVLIYPFFNILRYFTYTFGYIVGLVTKKQR
jgi:glycosyltransferase involved in cell wall biosynthesis